ncbi:MAG: hypothetical protein AMK71_02375 [Nitrospira bacterium SG8_35_4]|nr:MAG: hypothetical protein AMK71_02375 [Nitrospira bacterium SG8_35_4]
MKKLTCLILFLAFFAMAATSFAGIWGESVALSDLSDGRSFYDAHYDPPYSEGGLEGYWPSVFTIQWHITQDLSTSLWTYEYTLSAPRKDISHFILEITGGDGFGDILEPRVQFGSGEWQSMPVIGPRIWDGSNGKGTPGWPEGTSMYGIKFDSGDSTVSYAFETMRDPVWGNFYAKSGRHNEQWVYVFNNALAMENFDSNDKLDFIVRPDGGGNPPVVPEPASSLLFLTGGAVYAYRRYIKKA